MRFEILRGLHAETVTHGEGEEQAKEVVWYGPLDKDGNKTEGTVGNVVESTLDLEKKWPEKFRRVRDAEAVDQFSRMTVAQLRAFAESNGIDLGSARKKATIAAIVRESEAAGEAVAAD